MQRQPSLSLVLTGDSMITRRIGKGEDENASGLVNLIQEADVAFTNLEVLPNDFRGHPAQESGGTHLAAHSWVTDELTSIGFDLFATATNHALDYSVEGLLAMIDVLENRGISFAGVGRNLAEARMPVYYDADAGSVALVSCCSTFAKGQQAGEQRPDMPGRPGLNPLRTQTTYNITATQMTALQEIASTLGIEQQRQLRLELGFGFPPDDPEIFPYLDANYRIAESPGVTIVPNSKDLDAIAMWVREARARADVVIASIHAHEQGATREDPAAFIPTAARRMIEAGADVVVGHGPHLLRGMEMCDGKPIFYSLGNFIAQNDLVYKLPSDAYERHRVDPASTPGEIARVRSDNSRRGFPADVRYWQSVVPRCSFQEGKLQGIELIPVTLGQQQPTHRRGRPRIAQGDEAVTILERFATLSRPFGTVIERNEGRGQVVMRESMTVA